MADTPGKIRDVSLPARIYGAPLAHRLIPAQAGVGLVEARARMRARRNPHEREDIKRFLERLLAHTPRAGEADALVERWMTEKSAGQELQWRYWLFPKSTVDNPEKWREATAGGRGVVVVFGHLAPTWSVAPILQYNGMPVHIVIGPHYWDLEPGFKGLEMDYRRRKLQSIVGEERTHSTATVKPETLAGIVMGGEAVLLAWDAPGRAATPFLGRNIPVGGAAARLAFGTKVPVLPVVPERRGTRLAARFLDVIEPEAYEDHRALREAIAKAFEPVVVERPHAIELAWNPSPLVTDVTEAADAPWAQAPAA
jgi:lauroyl/myristoyl acyltransferase